jgi:hypothetical protein
MNYSPFHSETNHFEDRLQIEVGAANDFEHFSSGDLLLQCFITLARALGDRHSSYFAFVSMDRPGRSIIGVAPPH